MARGSGQDQALEGGKSLFYGRRERASEEEEQQRAEFGRQLHGLAAAVERETIRQMSERETEGDVNATVTMDRRTLGIQRTSEGIDGRFADRLTISAEGSEVRLRVYDDLDGEVREQQTVLPLTVLRELEQRIRAGEGKKINLSAVAGRAVLSPGKSGWRLLMNDGEQPGVSRLLDPTEVILIGSWARERRWLSPPPA